MIEYNYLLNDIIFAKTSAMTSLKLYLFVVFALILSLVIDIIFGELPTRVHPVVIVGSLISFFKSMFESIRSRISGLMVVMCVYLASGIILYIIYFISSFNTVFMFIVFTVLLSSTFSVNMLLKTAGDVKDALDESMEKARQLVSYLVSRDTDELTESFIVSATIESLTENITDSYVAPVFYYFVFATVILFNPFDDQLFYLLLVPMLYRASNTLDAMLGYKTDELVCIGYVPAKIDDALNYIPSRIAGIFMVASAYILKLNGGNAFRIMKRDARNCPSPNSGYTMATAAGALDIRLIKKDTYILGDGNKDITKEDISKAVNLSGLTIILFTVTIILLFTLIYVVL